jgi:hypothetical protein
LSAVLSGSNVNLTWTDTATNESGFKVYRRLQVRRKKWSPWTIVQTIAAPNSNQYTDLGLSAGTYQYYVTAYNAAGESAPSNTAAISK